MQTVTANQATYTEDWDAWLQQTAGLLRQNRLAEIDLETLAEELESMAKRDRRELISRLKILLAHLLKWQYQYKELSGSLEKWQGASWRGSIAEQRLQLLDQMQESPSLKNIIEESIAKAYPEAVELACQETGLKYSIFPVSCPYGMNEILDKNFFPISK